MGTHWEQNTQKNPNTLLAPKRGKKMAPWVHAGSPHWFPTISIPTSILLPYFPAPRGRGGVAWTVGTLFLLRCLLCRKDLVQNCTLKLEGSTNHNLPPRLRRGNSASGITCCSFFYSSLTVLSLLPRFFREWRIPYCSFFYSSLMAL
jgi:hypothetical protein